ncbi:gap junction delta-4 protein [Antennarius striatus]|uniref:gap junction delta-4 protein n=1 Tax=Antennarius striatus TaxID=241820 RepID=UPI0035AF9411
MVESSVSDTIFISINHSITFMGKVWLIVMIFLRILILLFAGYPLFQDEQERFVCNTIQPGCANVCYDLFSPISLFRFWLVQLTTLCLPYIIFIIYVIHKISNGFTVDPNFPGQVKASSLVKSPLEQFNKMSVNKRLERIGWAQCFTGVYFLHLVFRTFLEAGFGAAHYYLFGFYIPRRFLCQQPPCTTQVDCYISRPTEKTMMLNFMLGVAALSLFLNVLDFICTIKQSVIQKSRMKTLIEKIYEEQQCFLSEEGASGAIEPNASVTKDLEREDGQRGSFRKRQGSKGSSEHSTLPSSLGPQGCNTNGNNGYSISQEEAPERNGSEVALYPPELAGTPRSIRVSKRSGLKPPPPPRRDLRSTLSGSARSIGDVSVATAVCNKREGQYTLVELGTNAVLQTNDDGQEKKSEWV